MKKIIIVFMIFSICLQHITIYGNEDIDIYLNSQFENDSVQMSPQGWLVADKMNSIKIDQECNTNKFVSIDVSNGSDAYIERSLSSAGTGKIVVEADIKPYDIKNSQKNPFLISDSLGNRTKFIEFMQDGYITLYDGTQVMAYKPNKWYRVSVCFDFDEKVFSVYINKQKKINSVSIPSITDVKLIRMQVYKVLQGVVTGMGIDNVRVYTADKLLDSFPEEKVEVSGSALVSDKQLQDRMKDSLGYYLNSKYALLDGKKTLVSSNDSTAMFRENDKTYIPVRFTVEAFGGRVEWNAETGSVELVFNGKNRGLSADALLLGGNYYMPAEELAEFLDKSLSKNAEGLMVVLSNSVDFLDDSADYAYIFKTAELLAFESPKADELIALLKRQNPQQAHPRLLLPNGGFEKVIASITHDEYLKSWLQNVTASGNKILTEDVSKYVMPDGLRLTTTSKQVLNRVETLAFLYNVTGQEIYAERAWKELKAVAEFPNWNPYHFLDVGEMTAAFAIGYDWLYHYFTQEQRDLLCEAILTKGLRPAMDDYLDKPRSRTWKWSEPSSANNWNIVCNGGIAMGALAIGDEVEEAGVVLEHSIQSLKNGIKLFGPSGGWLEGITYWQYSIRYLAYVVSALDSSLGTDFGLFNSPGLSRTGYFLLAMTGTEGTFGFHDAGGALISSPELFWLAGKSSDAKLAGSRILQMKEFGMNGTVKDMLWYNPDLCDEDVNSALDNYFSDTEVASFKSVIGDSNALYAGFHAGRNDGPHAHLDAGEFEFHALGERWFYDLGSEDYNLKGGPGGKWSFYRTRPEGHNLYVINPGIEPGQDLNAAEAKITSFVSKPKGGYAIADIMSAYAQYASKAKRGVMMFNDRKKVLIQDEIKLKTKQDLYWFMHTKADIEILNDNLVVFTMGNKKLAAQIVSNQKPIIEVMAAVPLPTSPEVPGQKGNEGVQKLSLKFEDVEQLDLAVTLIPLYGESLPLEDASFVAMDQWTVPDGEIERVYVDSISVDGQELKEFSPERFNYEIILPSTATQVPVVTAKGDPLIHIEQASDLGMPTRITASDATNPDVQSVYKIIFKVLPFIGEPENSQKIALTNIKASAIPEPQNNPTMVTDGNLETRWAASGKQWISADLGADKSIKYVGVAFYRGASRTYFFELQTSLDGNTWDTCYKGESSGITNETQIFKVSATGRYVRLIGYGSSENAWNNVAELTVYE